MKENFQNAYNAMMKLSNHAKEGAAKFPESSEGSSFKYTWNEKAAVYKSCATLLLEACTNSGILLDTESNLHPVFDNILDNIKAAS